MTHDEIITDNMARFNLTREQAEAEYDVEVYSDWYKSLHGIRPRWMYDELRAMTPEQREAEFEKLAAYQHTDEYRAQLAEEQAWLERCEAENKAAWEAHCAVESAKADGLPVQRGMTLAEVLAVREDERLYPTTIIQIEERRGWL